MAADRNEARVCTHAQTFSQPDSEFVSNGTDALIPFVTPDRRAAQRSRTSLLLNPVLKVHSNPDPEPHLTLILTHI